MRLNFRTILLFGLIFSGCGKSDLRYLSEEASQNDGSGAIPNIGTNAPAGLVILFNKCSGCHGQTNGGQGGVSDILNPDHLISAGLAIPSSPDASPIMIEIVAGRMPPTGPLSGAEIDSVRQWIADGLPTNGVGPTPRPLPPLGPTFQSLYANVFLPKCVACHGPTLAEDGIRLDTYNGVRREVKVNNPADSTLYKVVNSGEMPEAPNAPLSGAEIAAILEWIRAGALNN